MVKFGKQIEESRRAEWQDGYVDYSALKKTLKEMTAAGTIHEFSEHTVYRAISLASSSNLLGPQAPRESDFFKLIDKEIDKVNAYSTRLRQEMQEGFEKCRADHDAWVASGSDPNKLEELHERTTKCSEALQHFESFVNLNYLAFSKILKKHDKVSSCPCRAPYLLRIQSETFAVQALPELIKGMSDVHASLAHVPSSDGSSGTPPLFDANQRGGTCFVRSTRKFWVATADVLKVKTFVMRNLPVYKFMDGATDSDLVTSIYFDSPSRELYQGRLKKFEGAIALRVRWYGPTPPDDAVVFVERKVHREDWFNDGASSTKERFPLRSDEVAPLLSGELTIDELRTRFEARKRTPGNCIGSLEHALALAAEVQSISLNQQLAPSLRTHYLRTAFQKTGDASVRISLDTDLCMSTELCGPGEWKRSAPLTSLSQVTHFPHAVLELKLQLAADNDTGLPPTPPAWVEELLASGCLIDAPKFSKFVHGTATLYQSEPSDGNPPVRELPYWWAPDVRVMWDQNRNYLGWTRPKASKGGGKGGGEEKRAVVTTDPLRRWFENLITCGSRDGLLT